jgi:hypothetical protein
MLIGHQVLQDVVEVAVVAALTALVTDVVCLKDAVDANHQEAANSVNI